MLRIETGIVPAPLVRLSVTARERIAVSSAPWPRTTGAGHFCVGLGSHLFKPLDNRKQPRVKTPLALLGSGGAVEEINGLAMRADDDLPARRLLSLMLQSDKCEPRAGLARTVSCVFARAGRSILHEKRGTPAGWAAAVPAALKKKRFALQDGDEIGTTDGHGPPPRNPSNARGRL